MTFEQAMHDTCRELGYDGHIKTIQYKKDAHTYAEKIAIQFGIPKAVKNSYMYLDKVDFCFFQNGNNVDFAISGVVSGNDKLHFQRAISRALFLCKVCEGKLKEEIEEVR